MTTDRWIEMIFGVKIVGVVYSEIGYILAADEAAGNG